jgi:hypothetical protein
MAEIQKKRFSFWGIVTIFISGAVIYFLMQGGQLFLLYAVATLVLVGLLLVVAFDVGIKKREQP